MDLERFVLASIFLLVIGIFFVSAGNNVMNVEADILGNGGPVSSVSIEIQDYLYFGNVSVGGQSEEFKIYYNNTGSEDVSITPEIQNSSENIFSYLHFRTQKTKTVNGSTVNIDPQRIGNFSMNISAPSGSSSYKSDYFYIKLDLRNYGGEINNDVLGHRAKVIFYAVAS